MGGDTVVVEPDDMTPTTEEAVMGTSKGKLTLNWEKFPENHRGMPIVRIGDHTFHIPFPELVRDSYKLPKLAFLTLKDGLEEPIVVNSYTSEVIDGMARIYLAHQEGLDAEEVPVEWRPMPENRQSI